jgi:VWFA-related protein
MRGVLGCLLALGAFVGLLGATSTNPATSSQDPSQKPTFRSVVALVPLDVRVIDNKTGKPVTDLAPRDFTVTEDGARQDIRHFLSTALGPDPAIAAAPLVPVDAGGGRPPEAARTLVRPTRRVFLFVLGEGRLQGPSKGLDALLDFLRTRLLPQDQVALYAYDRASAFTIDHEKLARIVERFRQENDALSSEVEFHCSGLAAVYGSGELPDSVQARIDRLFDGDPGLPAAARGGAQDPRHTERARRDARHAVEGAFDALIASGRVAAEAETSTTATTALSWGGFDNFVARNGRTLRDLGNLYAAIAYMREIDGEKHLVFLTEHGLRTGRHEEDKDLAAMAADGRVAIDVIQTGGLDPTPQAMMMRQGLKAVAAHTGGVVSTNEAGLTAFERLDAFTSHAYLLGYYPSNTKWDASFRQVVVRVSRPGVTVHVRSGYHSYASAPGFDRREYITRQRIESACVYLKDVPDIRVTVKASLSSADGRPVAEVRASIDPSRLYFKTRNRVRFGQVSIAVFAMDGARAVLGGTYRKQLAHLEYDEPTFGFVRENGIPYQARLPVPAGTRYVRVVVYDYMTDLVGSAGTWVQ